MRAADSRTEAMLTEYLDGTLAPDRVAELEAFLAAHPGERRAMEAIRAQRDAVRALPGERAPASVAAGVLAGLERSALLGSMAELQGRRIWPQRRASRWLTLAALLIGSAGLAGVIYLVIAPPAGARREMAAAAGPGPSATRSAGRPAAARSAAAPAPTADLPGAMAEAAPGAMQPPAALKPPAGQLGAGGMSLGGGGVATRTFTVYADDPAAARQRVEMRIRDIGGVVLGGLGGLADADKDLRQKSGADAHGRDDRGSQREGAGGERFRAVVGVAELAALEESVRQAGMDALNGSPGGVGGAATQPAQAMQGAARVVVGIVILPMPGGVGSRPASRP